MSKPKIFIGSSSESIFLVTALFSNLDKAQFAEITPWSNGVFKAGKYSMEDLADQLDSNDFGVFILSPDDVTVSRELAQVSPRDNVIFELGLFMGRLGKDRVLFVTPKQVSESIEILIPLDLKKEDKSKRYFEQAGKKFELKRIDSLKVPSDLFGITPLEYTLRTDGNWRAALTDVSDQILERISHLMKREDPKMQIEKLIEETDALVESYEQLQRLYLFTDQAKEMPERLEEKDYNRILMALDSGIKSGPFNLKGISLFKVEEQARMIIQCGQFKNVGEIGKPFSLDYDSEKNGQINVVDAHKSGMVTTYIKKNGGEYLISIPILNKFVVTLHYYHSIKVKDASGELEELLNNAVNVIDKLKNFLSKAPEDSLV